MVKCERGSQTVAMSRPYSLTDDIRKQERQRQLKIQQRQKRQLQNERALKADPVKLYHQIQRWQTNPPVSDKDKARYTQVKETWDYIIKHELHKEKMAPLVRNLEKSTTLRGNKLIYYNPELNPLGKVPSYYPNLPTNDKFKRNPPSRDPLIDQLKIEPPLDPQPKYYSKVYNVDTGVKSLAGEEEIKVTKRRKLIN